MSAAPLEMCLVLVRDIVAGEAVLLLGEKRRGFGRGRLVAPGGKIDAGETPRDAAVRELYEETGLVVGPENLQPSGVLDFAFPHGDSRPLRAHVFVTTQHRGALSPSDEIDGHWIRESDLPYHRMWADARHWLPCALAGSLHAASFSYGPDGVTLERVDGLR